MAEFDLRLLPVTPFAQNCSLLWDKESREGVLVDPGGEADRLLAECDEPKKFGSPMDISIMQAEQKTFAKNAALKS